VHSSPCANRIRLACRLVVQSSGFSEDLALTNRGNGTISTPKCDQLHNRAIGSMHHAKSERPAAERRENDELKAPALRAADHSAQ
jgi:hypothetical protein